MSKRTAFWLAWFTWVLYVIIAIVTLLLQFKDDPSSWLNDMFDALILLAFATVGSLVASRRPENPIGWLFCISTLLWALGSLLQEYTTYVLITVPGSLQAGVLMGIIGHWIGGIGFFLMLTASLLVVYLGFVFGGQYLLASLFGPNNAVVLVVSTLIVAALFQPLRWHVQQMVDRRFYRSKYDAAQVLASFSETLRQEVNLDQLYEQLLMVVCETVQPAHLSLWLRPRKPPEKPERPVEKL